MNKFSTFYTFFIWCENSLESSKISKSNWTTNNKIWQMLYYWIIGVKGFELFYFLPKLFSRLAKWIFLAYKILSLNFGHVQSAALSPFIIFVKSMFLNSWFAGYMPGAKIGGPKGGTPSFTVIASLEFQLEISSLIFYL